MTNNGKSTDVPYAPVGWNDKISSIDVTNLYPTPPYTDIRTTLRVTMYEHDYYKGCSVTIIFNNTNFEVPRQYRFPWFKNFKKLYEGLPKGNWNDRVSSWKIRIN